jgi:hypothetical protein
MSYMLWCLRVGADTHDTVSGRGGAERRRSSRCDIVQEDELRRRSKRIRHRSPTPYIPTKKKNRLSGRDCYDDRKRTRNHSGDHAAVNNKVRHRAWMYCAAQTRSIENSNVYRIV